MRSLISRICDLIFGKYLLSAGIALIIFLIALFFAGRLKINSNQLDLLPKTMPQVIEAKKINEMIGGTGFFIITLKFNENDKGDTLIQEAVSLKLSGNDTEALKRIEEANILYEKDRENNEKKIIKLKEASDILYSRLKELKNIRYIQHKFNLDFLTEHSLYRLSTPDLKEVIRRVGIKRDELTKKADPFYIELEETPDYQLDLKDIIKKYSKIGKKEVLDNYYVSPDRRMMVMIIKPSFSMNEIEICRDFLNKVKHIVESEHLEKNGISVGYTGSYVHYVTIYDSIEKSLKPTTMLSLGGITLILLLFIRKKRLVLSMLISLVYAVILIFGCIHLFVGELNLVTSMLGGILAGVGIDFGIHFIFRFREEFQRTNNVQIASKEAILNTGSAAAWSSLTTAAAFAALIASDFRGFSEFGLIASFGIILMAITMFFLTPLQLIIFQKLNPNFLNYLKDSPGEIRKEKKWVRSLNLPIISRVILGLTLFLFIPVTFIGASLGFDKDVRNMLESDMPSLKLAWEMNTRYEITGNPMAIATNTIAETAAVWEYLDPMPEAAQPYFTQAAGVFGFIPPRDQQLENYKLIKEFKKKNSIIKRSMIPADKIKYWDIFQKTISSKPYSYKDLPKYMETQFTNVEESKVKGWLTFIYPNIQKLFLVQDIMQMNRLIGKFEYPLLGRRTLTYLAYYIPEWERATGRKVKGSSKKQTYEGLSFSEREINGILDIANNISEKQINDLNFFPEINEILLTQRPFNTLADLQKTKKTAITTGSTLLMAQLSRLILEEFRFIVLGTMLIVCIILYLSFRRLDYSIVSLLTLLIGLIYTIGALAFFNVQLNFFNVAVLPVVIGYGINNGIFLIKRFSESKELGVSMYHTGYAVIASSLTTLAGWGSLAISEHPGLRSMGYAACISIGIMMIVAIFVLPSILQIVYGPTLKKRRKENREKIN